ncbi:MAG TPA: ATP-grasp domain-containing protein, partial [Limnochordia bacterium]|nr:ATP-grasp domain-containing protein [Limnochordia bacterium]
MKFHEYQAKQVFGQNGIPIPDGQVTADPAEAKAIATRLGGRAVVKAQVPIGGRGKAGAIKFGQSPDEVEQLARQILAMNVRGFSVGKVLVEGPADIKSEFYLSVTLDRARSSYVVIASASGGMEIEELAETQPEKVIKVWIDAALGL